MRRALRLSSLSLVLGLLVGCDDDRLIPESDPRQKAEERVEVVTPENKSTDQVAETTNNQTREHETELSLIHI